ncbi:hypothetical protein [Streptomyces sp. NPDC002265]|uniref:hypothetical protein n=1 Tax=Streptomyces sp. NPDC002265 TaxID=3154415 RepID=UPI0033262ED0
MQPVTPLTDARLTRRAQAGETGALGLLLARHHASMRAVALSRFLEDGVRQHLHRVTVGRDIDIWEMKVTTRHGSLHHCPPPLTWLMLRQDGRVRQLRVVCPRNPAPAAL